MNAVKFFNAIPPGIIKDNAAFVSNVIDKQDFVATGAKGILFVVQLGATDVAMAVLKVRESDTKTNGTTLGGTPADVHDFTSKPGAAADNDLYLVYVPMSAWTERYLQIQATAGNGSAGTYMSAIAILDMPGESGVTATLLGADVVEIAS